jgi:signal transduction histidine kinase
MPTVFGFRNVLVLLWIGAGLLLALTWGHVFRLTNESREREISAAQRDLSNLTRLSQEHANRTLRSADQVTRFIQSKYLELGNRLDLTALTQQGVIDTEIFNQVGVIDADGIYAFANRPVTSKLDLSDREHFRVHVATDTGELFISKPVIGRATGKWSVQLTRRITRPNGEFAGVVVVSIDPTYFTRFYQELNLGPGGLTALYGLDGIARARRVGDKEEFGSNGMASTLFDRLSKNELIGTYTQKSVVDGIDRVFFYRKIPQYALVTVAGIDVRYLLTNHNEARDALFLQAALVSLLIVALAGGLTRHLWLLRREAEARNQIEAHLRDRKEQLNAIFDLSPDGFVTFDSRHCVKFVSPAFDDMTGMGHVPLEGMDGRDFSVWLVNLCDPAAPFEGLELLRQRLRKDPADGQQVIELRSPHRVLKVQLRVSDSSTVSHILYFRDITHETEVEGLKSDFLATAAHELRTPMASIFGFSEILLAQEHDEEERKEFLGIIHKQSKLMVDILNELLDLARIEARKGKDFLFAKICLQDLLADMVKAFKCPPDRTAPELQIPDRLIYLMADSGKLRQAILNVLSNAYKYSPAGGPVAIVVDITAQDGQAPQASILVRDQGMGMTPSQAIQVGTRFYRADASGKVPGTGLGMAISKEILEHHKGHISIESTSGVGTEVTIFIPGKYDDV